MTIPESQLQTWANRGAVITAQQTHESIRKALNSYEGWSSSVKFDTYLQGPYRNTTNIRGDSDVDLVAELTSVYYSNLTGEEKEELGWEPATYSWSNFRSELINALNNYYGSQYVDTSGSKSVKLLPNNGRLKADVVVAARYNHYENLKLRSEGMTFFSGVQQIINYPKVLYNNGTTKNSSYLTSELYKPTIRIFKNSRNRIIVSNQYLENSIPSYFIECLLYNVPNNCFNGSYQDVFSKTVNWLTENLEKNLSNDFVCQNEMFYLFGNSVVQWNKAHAKQFISKLIELWNGW